MNKSIALGAVFAVAISMGVTPAFAQYMGSGGAGNQDGGHPSMSLEDTLELAKPKLIMQQTTQVLDLVLHI